MQSAADLTKQEQQRRQRQLARLIQPEFNPQRVLVLGDQGLAAALQALQVEAWGLAEGKGPALPDSWPQSYDLVVVQGSDVPAPPALPGNRVLFFGGGARGAFCPACLGACSGPGRPAAGFQLEELGLVVGGGPLPPRQ